MNRTSIAVVAACLLLAGCGDTSDQEPEAGSAPVTERRPVSPDDVVLASPTELEVVVSSCMGDPVVDELEEDDEQVRIRIVTAMLVGGEGPACADALTVTLDDPLDGRTVIDLVSGESLTVRPLDADTNGGDRHEEEAGSLGCSTGGEVEIADCDGTAELTPPPPEEQRVAATEVPGGQARVELLVNPTEVHLDESVGLQLANRGDALMWYGLTFIVERWDGHAWRPVPWPSDYEAPAVLEPLEPGETAHAQAWPPDGLSHQQPGWYRASWAAIVDELDPEMELEVRVQFRVRS